MEITRSDLEMVQKLTAPKPQIPSAGRRKKGKFPKELWTCFGEEFRSLRTRILTAFHDERHKTILVTSSLMQEGKSTVSSNLSRSFALAGRKTLLVDADLRRPDLHLLFGIERSGGLSDVVQGKAVLEEALASTDLPELDLLTSGTRVDAPAELIGSTGFPELLKDLVARYDFVVIDSPPLVSITDTAILARWADGILMVVNGQTTPREIVKGALEQLQDRPVLGVVLNGISTPRKYGYY